MKILVTGGAGFIGRHLIESLLQKNQDVTIFDNFSHYPRKQIDYLAAKGVNVVEGDITRKDQIISVTEGIDTIIHLAAKSVVKDSVLNPNETFFVNVCGTQNVLEACAKNKVTNLIAASSAAVYEDLKNSNENLTEKSNTNPISPYGKSKLEMENIIKNFPGNFPKHRVILRLFNVYGSNQLPKYGGVITKFIHDIKNNKSLHVYGDGQQSRDFVSVYDVVNSFNLILNNLSKKFCIYNIASGDVITILELAQLMIKLSGKNLQIKFEDGIEQEIQYSCASIDLARKEIGYAIKNSFEEDIKKLLDKNLFL